MTLSSAETMARLRISRATLYNWINAGKLHPRPEKANLRLPRIRFLASEVEALARGEKPGQAERQ